MSTLTVTATGQVTLRRELLKHLGVQPGEKIAINKLPNGRIEMKAAQPTGKISDISMCSRAEDAGPYRLRKSTKSRDKGGPADDEDRCRRLINGANVVVNRQAVEAGLVHMKAGGDFADGVIAYEENWLGAETFVSFDEKVAKLMEAPGRPPGCLYDHLLS
jgi:hypothetical protein